MDLAKFALEKWCIGDNSIIYMQLNPVQFELDCLEVFAGARSLGFAILFKSFYFVYHKLDYFKVLPVSLGLDFYSIW